MILVAVMLGVCLAAFLSLKYSRVKADRVAEAAYNAEQFFAVAQSLFSDERFPSALGALLFELSADLARPSVAYRLVWQTRGPRTTKAAPSASDGLPSDLRETYDLALHHGVLAILNLSLVTWYIARRRERRDGATEGGLSMMEENLAERYSGMERFSAEIGDRHAAFQIHG